MKKLNLLLVVIISFATIMAIPLFIEDVATLLGLETMVIFSFGFSLVYIALHYKETIQEAAKSFAELMKSSEQFLRETREETRARIIHEETFGKYALGDPIPFSERRKIVKAIQFAQTRKKQMQYKRQLAFPKP